METGFAQDQQPYTGISTFPTIVATFDFDNRGNNHLSSGTGNLVLPNQRYNEVISEAGGGLQGLNEIARILRPGGLYFVFGSALRTQVLNLPHTLKIILVTGGSSNHAITSREEYEEASRWRQFETDPFLSRVESDPNRIYSFIIAKQREDGSFPSEAPEYMRSYLQDSGTATE